MSDQPPKPEDIPSFEDLLKTIGPEKMAFFSDMVRPDQHEEREEDANLPSGPTSREVVISPEEQQAIIEHLESAKGRKLTPQEIYNALEQARST